jgi:hypothetical protein
MKIIAEYRLKMQADEDRAFLIHQGIATIVIGNVGPHALDANFAPEPISLAVHELHAPQAQYLLTEKYRPHAAPLVV